MVYCRLSSARYPHSPTNPHSTILNLKSIRDRQTAIDNAARV